MMSRREKMAMNLELALRIGLLFLVIYWVVQIIAPFLPAIIWAVIIAVASYPAFRWLEDKFGGRSGRAATVYTLLLLLLLIMPSVWLGQEAGVWGASVAERIRDGSLEIPPPPERVAGWPLIGERIDAFWTLASTNLSEAAQRATPQLRAVGEWMLRAVAGLASGVLQFALSIIIAGVLLTHTAASATFARRLFERLLPGSGAEFTKLSEQTIRSVATGVIGVALIQGALIGVAFVIMGIPGAPIWIIAVILLGIVQLPATLVTVPVIIWTFGAYDTLPAAIFTAWVIPAGLSDNVLKPLLLGRGVETPMLVIFVGAIGGFILSGIVGLFVGAVIVVLAYELFQAWLNQPAGKEEGSPAEGAADATSG